MKNIFIRFLIVFFLSSFWMAYRIFYIKEDKSLWNYKECIYDYVFDSPFKQLTIFISQQLNIRDLLLILSGSATDFYLLYFLLAFYKSGNSLKPIFHFMKFYLVKFCVLDQIFRFRILDIFLFDNPGYPSLTFDYGRKPYTFYSEYSGLPLILALQFNNLKYYSLSKFGILLTALNSFVVIVTRMNTILDVIFGILAAHYFYLFTENFNFLDKVFEKKKVLEEETMKKDIITIEFENKNNPIENNVELHKKEKL